MAKFHYKASRGGGDVYEGEVEAKDRFAVYERVRSEGGTILSLSEERTLSFLRNIDINNLFGSVKINEKIMLTRNLSAMIKAGLSLSRAIDVLVRQTKNSTLQKILEMVNEDVRQGSNFHTALEKHPKVFSPLFTAMVRAGEESGKLAETLSVVGGQLKRSYDLQRKVKGALMYPSIIVIAMIIIGILMLIFVVPTLTQTFNELGAELPGTTKAIIAVSNALTTDPILYIAIAVGIIVLLIAGARTEQGNRLIDFAVIRVPLVSPLVKETNTARTMRTLSSLLSSGVDVVDALTITRDVLQNSYFKEVIQAARQAVERGDPISKAFAENENLYPVLVSEMVAVGEETGQLSDMLLEVAEFYESEVAQKTKNLSTIIEPFLMIVIGIVVGFFALSMIAPIYSISDSI